MKLWKKFLESLYHDNNLAKKTEIWLFRQKFDNVWISKVILYLYALKEIPNKHLLIKSYFLFQAWIIHFLLKRAKILQPMPSTTHLICLFFDTMRLENHSCTIHVFQLFQVWLSCIHGCQGPTDEVWSESGDSKMAETAAVHGTTHSFPLPYR